MKKMIWSLLFIGIAAALAACKTDSAADMVITNGVIITMDDAHPEAEALAIRGDRILAVGSREEIAGYIGSKTEVIDAGGQLVIPGFIEGHAHFAGVGNAKIQLDLMNLTSWQQIVDMVAEAAESAEHGEVIRGRGWHQDDWHEPPDPHVNRLPLHDGLSAVSPENPVVLTHTSGHMNFANAKAMELAGIDEEAQSPEGGEIVRDAQGRITGAFRQTASRLLGPVMRMWEPDFAHMIALASEEVLTYGVTTVQDAGSSMEDIRQYKELADAGALQLRLWIMARDNNEQLMEHLPRYTGKSESDTWFTVGGIKKAIDGALGTHGAWLLEPYSDDPQSSGFNITPLSEIREAGEFALQHDLQLAVHAIGDRGNREMLDLYEDIFAEHRLNDSEAANLRWRIEHAQHLHPDDIPRFAQLGVIASMQGNHATSDGPWVPRRLGEERSRDGAYAWRKLLDAGAVIVNGTDAPVEPIDPVASFHASVTREMANGEAFYPHQAMTREEALRSYTLDAAFAIFREDDLGSITPGKLADIVILSENIMEIPEERIRDAKVRYTIVGGEVRYRK